MVKLFCHIYLMLCRLRTENIGLNCLEGMLKMFVFFRPKFKFFRQILDQNVDFWPKFGFLAKIWIFS